MLAETSAAQFVSREQPSGSDGRDRQSDERLDVDTVSHTAASHTDIQFLWDKLDTVRSDLLGDASSKSLTQKLVVGTTAVTVSALTVGYVAWALRIGYFLTSMLSSLPAWTYFDPIPILDSFEDEEASGSPSTKDEDISLESLVTQ
jgi:hypothetical protein